MRIDISWEKYVSSYTISPEEMTWPSIFKSAWRVYGDE